MQQILSCNLKEYNTKNIFFIDKSLILLTDYSEKIAFYNIDKNEIVNDLNNFKGLFIHNTYKNYIITSDYYNFIYIYDYLNNKIVVEIPILRESASFVFMNDNYIIIKDPGYIGCRLYKKHNDSFVLVKRLKFNGKNIVNARLENDVLYAISLDGYLLKKKLTPNYASKQVKIADKLLYGMDIDDKYIYIVTIDKKIIVIDKFNFSNKKVFNANNIFIQKVESYKDFILTSTSFNGFISKDIIIFDSFSLDILSNINCGKNIVNASIKDDYFYIYNYESFLLDIYKHNSFKNNKLHSF